MVTVIPHQDSWYLHTKPESKLIGFWIALDDATVENGCLWFAPGSHNSGVHRRFCRNPDKSSDEFLTYTSPQPFYPSSNFVPVPVKKGNNCNVFQNHLPEKIFKKYSSFSGSLVLIDGRVVHMSEHNKSDTPRHAYTFHVVDFFETIYSEDNWLQPTETLPFKGVYENR